MTTPIRGFSEFGQITLQPKAAPAPKADFAKSLATAIEKVSDVQKEAETTNDNFVNKDLGKLHENSIALEKANIALRSLVSVRNKIVDAYKDVMHMNG